ncbi:Ig-like domain-containing protein, partial [Microcoleus sp. S13_C5]
GGGGGLGGLGGGGGGGVGSGGGGGLGGAIFIRTGSLTLNNATFSNNTATGGTGANNGQGKGGAIFAMQSLTNTNSNNQGMPTALPTVTTFGATFTGNTAANQVSTPTANTPSGGVGNSQDNNDVYGTITGNTAPVLADTVVTLSAILEDAVAPTGAVGTLISSIAAIGTGQNNITDPDTGVVAGVAITAADTTNGSWFYTIDGGTTWTALGTVSNTNARLLAANANTRIYFQPTANYNGTVTNGITFRAWDTTSGTNGGIANTSNNGGITAFSTATDTADITVTAVNDIPSFTATNPTSVNEDAGAQTVANWATFNAGATNESTQTATYTVSNISNSALFATSPAIDANGNLTYTPATDANGTSTFDVKVQDSGGTANGGVDTSATQTFSITVNSVNDIPSFTATNPTTVNEDAGAQTVTNWATFNAGATNESTQTATYTVSNISNSALFATSPAIDANGNLTYTPATDANGTSTFDVKV